MDDDWGSPWADADDHSANSAFAISANRAIEAASSTASTSSSISSSITSKLKGLGEKLSQRNAVLRDTPEKISSNNAVIDPWASNENGFGDEEAAWANASPAISTTGPGLEDPFPHWGTPPPPPPLDIPSFSSSEALQPIGKAPGSAVDVAGDADVWSRGGLGSTVFLTATSKEVEAWGAGSDWGDMESSVNEGDSGAHTVLPVTPAVHSALGPVLEAKNAEIGTEVLHGFGSTHNSDEELRQELGKENAIAEFKQMDDEMKEKADKTDEAEDRAESPVSDIFEDAVEAIPADDDESKEITNEEPEIKTISPRPTSPNPISEGKKMPEENTNVELSNDFEQNDGDDDDFGDFADEEFVADADKEGFIEEPIPLTDEKTSNVPIPPAPAVSPVSFDVDASLVSKLYPIPTSRPKPPPVEKLIYTTEARKAWYRISQTGTKRKSQIGDDDYVRITWLGSRTRADVHKIVGRWIMENKDAHSSTATNKRTSAMFGWGEAAEAPARSKRFSLQDPPTSAKVNVNHNRQMSDVSSFGKFNKSAFAPPTNFSSLPERSALSTPQAASFGWGDVEGPEKSPPYGSPVSRREPSKPGTPVRLSFDAPPLAPSRPNTPFTATAPHTPINTVSPSNVANSSIHQSPASPNKSIHGGSEDGMYSFTAQPVTGSRSESGSPVARTAFAPVSLPASPSKSSQKSEAYATNAGGDEWRAFENLFSKSAPKLDAIESGADQTFDEWEAFETLTLSVPPTPMREHSLVLDQTKTILGPEPKLTHVEKHPWEIPLPMSPIRIPMAKEKEWHASHDQISPGPSTPKSFVQLESPPWNRTPKSARFQSESKRKSKLSEVATLDALEIFGSPAAKPEPVKSLPILMKPPSMLKSPPTPAKNGVTRPAPPVLSPPKLSPVGIVTENAAEAVDDDDDWGEMVESSPIHGTTPFSFDEPIMPLPTKLKPLQIASPSTFSDKRSPPQSPFGNINETFASRPGGAAEFLFSEFTKPIPTPTSSTPSRSFFDLNEFDVPATIAKNSKGKVKQRVSSKPAAADPWGDLSFFDSIATSTASPAKPVQSKSASRDLWDSLV
ncbi:hypothetical protein RUND412_002981 [Rhizina undulata]